MTIRDRFKNIFEPELLSQIESRSEIKLIPEGGIILDIGQSVRIVPLLLKGVLKISRVDDSGREILLYYVHANESCAMTFTCCMQQHPSEIKATAESEVELLAIPIGVMDEWLSKYPTWKSFVMRTIRNQIGRAHV